MASIRERTSGSGGTVWAVLFRQGGKQTSKTFKDHKKAKNFARLVDALGVERALKELLAEAQPEGITVDEMAAAWLEYKARDVTPRTLEDYRRDVANYVKPWFGHRAAEHVDEADVQKWVDHMARTLSPKSVADRHMLLHSMYKYGKAKSRRLVTHNPCLETEMPKRTRRPLKGTRVTEWRAIMRAARAKGNDDAADLILFLGSIGWRWSEAAALCADAVEDDGVNVWVDVVRVFRMVEHKQVLMHDAAKSEAGFRRSKLPTEAAKMIRRRVVGKRPGDFIFTNSRGNHWNQNTFLRDTWPSLLKAAEVGSATRKPTPHWLRHMAVAVMAQAKVPMHEIQRIIGHEDIGTTNNTYGGMVTTLGGDSLANMDLILSGEDAAGAVVAGDVIKGELA